MYVDGLRAKSFGSTTWFTKSNASVTRGSDNNGPVIKRLWSTEGKDAGMGGGRVFEMEVVVAIRGRSGMMVFMFL